MRAWEIIREGTATNSFADNLKLQSDQKANQAKELKRTAAIAKKREQIKSTSTDLSQKQRELTSLSSPQPKPKKIQLS